MVGGQSPDARARRPDPVRLLHVTASYLPAVRYGGLIVSVHGLCRSLAERGHDVHVFTTSVDGPGDSPVPHGEPIAIDGVHVWYFRSSMLRRFYYAPPMADAARLHVRGFDVVHTHAMFLWPGWAVCRVARQQGVPYVVSPRGMLEKELIEQRSPLAKAALIGFFERGILERAAGIHVTSTREARELTRFGFALPKIYDIPNGTDHALPTGSDDAVPDAIRRVAAEGPFALFLGRISWKKGLDRLVAALPFAPDVRVIVAGNDDEHLTPALAAKALRHGVADRLHFVGPVHGTTKSWLLSRAMFMVVPSYSENFGNVVIESLTHERPVLMTPEVGVSDVVAKHGAGVIAPGGPGSFGLAMAALAADAGTRLTMGRRGRDLVERHFGWAAVAARAEQMYEEVRGGARAS
jgi:glycosyltransferase involved in cell wall biosynthesis